MTPDTGISGPSKNDEPESGLPSFAVIVPMFNEAAGAERCVREIVRALSGLRNRTMLVLVDDGSRDGTGAALAPLKREGLRFDLVTHEINRGYGAALVTGARRAAELGLEYAVFMDSDLTNSPDDLARFADVMGAGADVIKATRFRRGGRMVGVPWQRALISRVGNLIARLLFRLPISDCTNGFRAVRTNLLVRMQLRERGFPVIMEELYWCGFLTTSFAELPVTLTSADRPTNFRYGPSVFASYLRYPLYAFFGMSPVGSSAR
jgi:glycosyltransferase involved in cell wall biosynthesis